MLASKKRIFFNYRHIDGHWGGANSFIRNLKYVDIKRPEF